MGNIEEQKRGMEIGSLLSGMKERKPPIVLEQSTIQDVINAMIRFPHSRVVYVQKETGELVGTISLGVLAKHVFSRSHEPQIHARALISMITTETAKDLMQKKPVFGIVHEAVGTLLKRMVASNVKEIPILDEHHKIVADVTMLDLLKFLLNTSQGTDNEGNDGH